MTGGTGIHQRSEEAFMREALRLARKSPLPYPNPWVGCVITNGARVVGRGFHRGAGSSHAEVVALARAGSLARGGDLYVTLEPCCHYGRTPPCTGAILAAGIRRVVYAIRDPNPVVSGRGASTLRRNGVEVVSGLLDTEAAALNEVYLKFRRTGLPFVNAKCAASLDGRIATRTGDSKWITDGASRRRVRALRAENQAVLVGINTVLADNPNLGAREAAHGAGTEEPWRVVLDSRLRTPVRAKVVRTGRAIVASTVHASAAKRRALERAGAIVWTFRGGRVPVQTLLRRLAAEGILSVMVEGGGEVLGSFIDAHAVDRFFWFAAPLVIGSADARPSVAGRGVARVADATRLRDISIERTGNCWLVRGNVSRWALARS